MQKIKQKRLKFSKDTDWSRAFRPKSREWEFSQKCGLRKLANHNTLHFRSFLAKTNDSTFHKSPKSLFLPIFGPLSLPFFWEKIRIFVTNQALSLLTIYGLHVQYQKKLMSQFRGKFIADWLTVRLNWQRWIYRILPANKCSTVSIYCPPFSFFGRMSRLYGNHFAYWIDIPRFAT